MIESLKALLGGAAGTVAASPGGTDDIAAATAALLVEAALMDGHFDAAERATIERLLGDRFDIDEAEARQVVAAAEAAVDNSNRVFAASQVVAREFDYEDRVAVMEMLWEVVFADGEVHDFEANLARRVAGLIHVDDRHSGAARKRAMERLGAGTNGVER